MCSSVEAVAVVEIVGQAEQVDYTGIAEQVVNIVEQHIAVGQQIVVVQVELLDSALLCSSMTRISM